MVLIKTNCSDHLKKKVMKSAVQDKLAFIDLTGCLAPQA